MKARILLAALSAMCLASPAGVIFSEKDDALIVTDYAETAPCDLATLARVDRACGWNKVAYDSANDTYRVACSLWIGANDRTHTYFRIGDKAHPKEKAIVSGDVTVKPYWVNGVDPAPAVPGAWWTLTMDRFVNRLTLGDPNDTSIRAELLIDNEKGKGKGRTLIVGGAAKNLARGGQLHAYHSRIGAVGKTPLDKIGARANNLKPNAILMGAADAIILKNVTIADVAGMATHGFSNRFYCVGEMENVTFERCGTALIGNFLFDRVKGCSFKSCDLAFADYGNRGKMIFENCVFADNARNFSLSATRVRLLDSDIDTPRLGDRWAKGEISPALIKERQVIVKAVFADGSPAPGATVTLTPDNDDAALEKSYTAITQKDGATPETTEKNAISLCYEIVRPDGDNQLPTVKGIHYTVRVSLGTKRAEITGFYPTKPWETLSLILR